MSLLPSSFLNHICSPASILQSPFYHRLCCFTLDTPSRPHGALEMSFCKRSDVVGYANTPSQALLLTEVSCHFSKKKKQKKHLHTITTRQKVRKDTHLKNSNGHLNQFLAGVKQTLHVSSCINIYIWFHFNLVVELMNWQWCITAKTRQFFSCSATLLTNDKSNIITTVCNIQTRNLSSNEENYISLHV